MRGHDFTISSEKKFMKKMKNNLNLIQGFKESLESKMLQAGALKKMKKKLVDETFFFFCKQRFLCFEGFPESLTPPPFQ